MLHLSAVGISGLQAGEDVKTNCRWSIATARCWCKTPSSRSAYAPSTTFPLSGSCRSLDEAVAPVVGRCCIWGKDQMPENPRNFRATDGMENPGTAGGCA